MPSVYNTFGSTQAKISASRNFNIVSTTSKAGGSSTMLNEVAVAGNPAIFDGSSNDQITDTIIASTGNVGLSIGYAAGSAIGAADEVRQLIETDVANSNLVNQDGQHQKLTDVEVFTSGLIRLRNGTWVNQDGDAASATGISVNHQIGGTGGDTSISGVEEYNYRIGNSNINKELPARTLA
jgi:hypothetical protein